MKHTTLDARPETELNVDQVTFPLKSLPSELRCQIYKEMSALACKAPFSQMLQTERTDEEVSAHALTYGEALLRQVNRVSFFPLYRSTSELVWRHGRTP